MKLIRRAAITDIDAILHVINKSNSESYREIIPVEYFKEPVLTTSEILEFFRKMDFYVYEEDETIIGVSAIEKKCEDHGELKWIYVLPERQRRGIGTELVRHLEGVAKDLGLSEMILFTDEKATWAINFYEKMDYKQTDKRRLPWGHDIMMKKRLSPID